MTEERDKRITLHCSFCGKSQHEVRKLVAGPTVFICDECVGLCNDIVAEGAEGELNFHGYSASRDSIDARLSKLGINASMLLEASFGVSLVGTKWEIASVEEFFDRIAKVVSANLKTGDRADQLKNEMHQLRGELTQIDERYGAERQKPAEALAALEKEFAILIPLEGPQVKTA